MPRLVHYTKEDIEAALFPEKTLAEAGRVLGITRERVRQLVVKYDIQRHDHRWMTPIRWDAMTEKQQAAYARRSHWPREGIRSLKRRLGWCTVPGCFQSGAGKSKCLAHRESESVRVSAIYAMRKANGVCVQCSKPLASGSIAQCDKHLRKNREAGRRLNEARRKVTSYAYR